MKIAGLIISLVLSLLPAWYFYRISDEKSEIVKVKTVAAVWVGSFVVLLMLFKSLFNPQ